MANRNVFAIAGIVVFLITGAVVVIGVAGTVLLLLYAIATAIFGVFGIELPHLH